VRCEVCGYPQAYWHTPRKAWLANVLAPTCRDVRRAATSSGYPGLQIVRAAKNLHAPPMESEQRRHAATDVGIRTFNAALQYARPCVRRI